MDLRISQLYEIRTSTRAVHVQNKNPINAFTTYFLKINVNPLALELDI